MYKCLSGPAFMFDILQLVESYFIHVSWSTNLYSYCCTRPQHRVLLTTRTCSNKHSNCHFLIPHKIIRRQRQISYNNHILNWKSLISWGKQFYWNEIQCLFQRPQNNIRRPYVTGLRVSTKAQTNQIKLICPRTALNTIQNKWWKLTGT
jgi:hypothetical protein